MAHYLLQDLTDANTDIEETLNFITAGGDSVRAVQLASDIENYVDVRLPQLLDVLLHNTLGDVCKYVLSAIRERSDNEEDELRDCKYDVADVNDELNEMTDSKYTVDDISGEISETRNKHVRKRRGSKFDEGVSGSSVNHKPLFNREISTTKRKLDEDIGIAADKSTKNFNEFQFSICRTNKVMKVNDNCEMVNKLRRMGNIENLITGKVMKLNDNSEKVKNNTQIGKENLVKGKVDDDKVVMERNCRLEEVWRYNTGKCVDASPLIAVQSR